MLLLSLSLELRKLCPQLADQRILVLQHFLHVLDGWGLIDLHFHGGLRLREFLPQLSHLIR